MDLASVVSGTRGLVVGLVRRGVNTVSRLADTLGVTENAVRSHLTTLERDGIVEAYGKIPGARRPSILYRLSAEAEAFYHRGYEPVLIELARVLESNPKDRSSQALFAEVGLNLALRHSLGEEASFEERLENVKAILASLGAVLNVRTDGDGATIRAEECPLGSLVSACPEACSLGKALIGGLMGTEVQEQCEHGAVPACQFLIPSA